MLCTKHATGTFLVACIHYWFIHMCCVSLMHIFPCQAPFLPTYHILSTTTFFIRLSYPSICVCVCVLFLFLFCFLSFFPPPLQQKYVYQCNLCARNRHHERARFSPLLA
uniref:Uncharacterized protein n=1 Tax=Trypanosoma vivax (strain Y486) TaxID=1055687 RepID=G0TWQ5_TRYVY|nr:hypothetical protein TVY486_0601840 [Trypanosoma vivax Y486]